MTRFTPEQREALLDLRRKWPEERFVLVGATAIASHVDLQWRQTLDIDLTCAAASEVCQRDLASLPGWSPDARKSHAWNAPGGVRVDVIPITPSVLRAGHIQWPDGTIMNTVGLRAAFVDATRVRMAEDMFIQVAAPAALVLLKMAAYLDRPERGGDLQDLAHLMTSFEVPAEERWSNEIIDLELDYELVAPYALGRRVGVLANEEERTLVRRFLAQLNDSDDRSATMARMQRSGPASWQQPGAARLHLDAFLRGFDSQIYPGVPRP